MDPSVEFISEKLKPYATDVLTARKWFAYWERIGMHIIPVSFYSPIPNTRNLAPKIWRRRSKMPGIDMNEEFQFRFLQEVITKYRDEYEKFSNYPTDNKAEFHYDNNQFIGLDPIVLHCILREYKPMRVIEIGSGYSTLVAAAALRLNCRGEITCIEPFPPDFIRQGIPGVKDLILREVQEIHLVFFDQLSVNDVLFIDSTHVAKIGSDVQYLFLEVLPRLRPGVLVHVHDIFFPNDYPEKWIKENNFFWNEQYLLQCFLIGNTMFKVHFCGAYIGKLFKERMTSFFPNYSPGMGGGSFWMRRI